MSLKVIAHQVLDCSGLACPMPILKTRKALDGLQIGQVLEVISTDPGSVSDMEAFARKTGNRLVESERSNNSYVFYIEKSK